MSFWHRRVFLPPTPRLFIPAGLWFVLTFSVVCAAGVDLWAQTLIHIVLAILAVYSIEKLPGNFLNKHRLPLLLWAGVLMAMGFSTLKSGAPARSQQELWNWFDYFLIFVLAKSLDEQGRRTLERGLFITWTCLLIGGGWQYATNLLPPNAGLLNANVLGSYLLIPLWFGLKKCVDPNLKRKGMAWGFTGAVFLLLLATRSVGVLLAFGASLAYFTNRSIHKKEIKRACWAFSLVCLCPFLWKIITTWDLHRLIWWKAALVMGGAHPWIGLGPATFELALPHWPNLNLFTFYAHNTFLQWWAEIGLLGLGGVLILLGICLRDQLNPYHKSASIGLLVHNLLEYSLILPSHALLFWVLQAPSVSHHKPSSILPSPPERPARLAIQVLLISMALISVVRFQASRHYAQATYFFKNGQVLLASEYATRSIEKNPLSPDPHALLARVQFEESLKKHSRGAMDQALAHTLNALQRAPLYPLYWVNAMQLYEHLGFPQKQEELRRDLITAYPYLKNDQRLKSNT